MTTELNYLRTWIGRTQAEQELVSPRLAQQLAATLGYEDAPHAGSPLPPLWHWALFPHIVSQPQVGVDGHPKRGGFLPPVPLPRRMWAGSRVRFERPLLVGSLRGTTTMAMVADARGFGANRRRGSLQEHHLTAVDVAGYVILVVLVGTAIVLNHFHLGARPY